MNKWECSILKVSVPLFLEGKIDGCDAKSVKNSAKLSTSLKSVVSYSCFSQFWRLGCFAPTWLQSAVMAARICFGQKLSDWKKIDIFAIFGHLFCRFLTQMQCWWIEFHFCDVLTKNQIWMLVFEVKMWSKFYKFLVYFFSGMTFKLARFSLLAF